MQECPRIVYRSIRKQGLVVAQVYDATPFLNTTPMPASFCSSGSSTGSTALVAVTAGDSVLDVQVHIGEASANGGFQSLAVGVFAVYLQASPR